MPVDHPQIPKETLANWQQLVDLVAELADVPASLIMKTDAPDHAVLITSDHPENPYPVGLTFQLNPKLYCQGVLQRDGELVVEDATCDPVWSDNDDLEHGMTFYIGLPLKWPDGSVFGTICVLDRKQNRRALLFREGLTQFARMVESDLALLQEVYLRRALEEKLNETLAQLETRVSDRTRELQEANTALRVLLSSLEDDRKSRDMEIVEQVRSRVLPYLDKVRAQLAGDEAQSVYLDLVENNLNEITSSLSDKLTDAFAAMTPTEMEIAQMVMFGKTTKDIAKALSRETSTIDFHRNNIRRKLGLDGRDQNLRSHLLSIS
ncbi:MULTISPECIES: LuxR C-terminal-related transcriptional regulator [unclassified Ruegeria]|uniref:LuxR C-terminal-related transcriptional regulator n=1 Tax=unclassified Ruegeria TaxID=2625375 RepID=UPI001488B594|nr:MULTISPECIES: LuxR C-terminal-related transcriptional regulator [unclassified Ruegeria]NOD46033.1 GAF domain-containing protein [Ruegeria sp. HKCCD5849]NOD50667.1 GAF domain-containing protein [Ruegeria sp. HKCCD5851]NOD67483.1 GAF domain-containing protein [Ruegeria sp. HKCCD7303]